MSYVPVLAGIAVANILAIATPGPAFPLVSRASAGRSRAVGLATGLGVTAAASLWALAAIFGVAVVMTRVAAVYGAVQLVGGACLIWLGLSAWSESQRGNGIAAPAADAPAGADVPLTRAAFTEVSLTPTNPKVVIHFSRIFVALLPENTPMWLHLAALGIVLAEELGWWMRVAFAFSRASTQAAYRRVRGVLDRVMGVVFVAFGARIVALACI